MRLARTRSALALVLALSAFAMQGCAGSGPSTATPSRGVSAGHSLTSTATVQTLTLVLRLPSSVVCTSRKNFATLRLTNTGAKTVRMVQAAGLPFEMQIGDSRGTIVWSYDLQLFKDMAAPGVEVNEVGSRPPTMRILRAHESTEATIPFQISRPGIYTLVASLGGGSPGVETPSLTVEATTCR